MNTINLRREVHPTIAPEAVRCVLDTPRLFSLVVREVTTRSNVPPDPVERMRTVSAQLNVLLSKMAEDDEAARFEASPELVSSIIEPEVAVRERCLSFVE